MSKKSSLGFVSWFTSKNETVFLILSTILAFFLRFFLIPQNLFFGPEQGVDFLVIRSVVVDHKLTLIGAKTDIAGIFHGPLYYYIASIPFALTHGNPVAVSAFLIFLQSLTVIPLYFLGKKMFSQRVGILAVVLFIFSFEAIASSRWLSGQPLAIPLTILLFWFLYMYLKGKAKNLLFVAICFGLIAQLEFLNLILFTAFLIVVLSIYYKHILRTNVFILFGSLVIATILSVGTFILFDIRHNFLIFHSIIGAFSVHGGFHVSYVTSLLSTFQIYDEVFVRSLLPLFSTSFGLILLGVFAFLIFQLVKNKGKTPYILIFTFLIIPAVVLLLLHQSVLEHFLMPAIPFICLSAGVLVDYILQNNKLIGYAFFALLVIGSIVSWILYLPENKNIFFQSTQPFLHYSDQRKAIETVYKDAQHKPFAFQAYTIPYWSQQGWEYLFWYFGSTKYGYYPSPVTKDKLYVIVQKDPGKYQEGWLKDTVAHWGKEQKSFTFGALDLKVLRTATEK